MTTPVKPADHPDVPAQVFEKFLHALAEAGLSDELSARLRKTLLEDKTFTEPALKTAIFGGVEPPV